MTDHEILEEQRSLLFSIAYRMLGTAAEAEDMVQEAFARFLQISSSEIRSAKAYLAKTVTHLCLNHLQSAYVQRKEYIGPWLPEPILTSDVDLEREAILSESLSMAFLIMLESLTPVERAVFLLRDVFEYDYDEVARLVGKSDANCRQILRRAREHLSTRQPRFDASPEQKQRLTQQFVAASTSGDLQGLLALLDEETTLYSDGGGQVAAALKPIYGGEKVARFIFGVLRKFVPPDARPCIEEVNGQPGVVIYSEDKPRSVLLLDVAGERVRNVYVIVNPEKLGGVQGQAGYLSGLYNIRRLPNRD
jgi:RNA polymerase sigma-70 factor, ECF subfamily